MSNAATMYIHSKCCGAHWVLKERDGKVIPVCARCSLPAGEGVFVEGKSARMLSECCSGQYELAAIHGRWKLLCECCEAEQKLLVKGLPPPMECECVECRK